MLNERQLALLNALESQPAAPGTLAQQTGVSARTILRDIDYINFTLGGKARNELAGNVGEQSLQVERYRQILLHAIPYHNSATALRHSGTDTTIDVG